MEPSGISQGKRTGSAGRSSTPPPASGSPDRARDSWLYRDSLSWWPLHLAEDPIIPAGPVRVVIVDDNARTRAGLRALLGTTPGVKVVGEADDGEDAVRLVARLRPDVVLMDVRLPGIDGLEATRVIKSRQPEVRVVVLTIAAAYRAGAMAAGADAFLVKGGSANELVSAVLGRDDPGPSRQRRPPRPPERPMVRHRPTQGAPFV